jgi:hypothetical protein
MFLLVEVNRTRAVTFLLEILMPGFFVRGGPERREKAVVERPYRWCPTRLTMPAREATFRRR